MREEGLRIEFDQARSVVNLMIGNECVDQMTYVDFRAVFGVESAVRLVRGK